ncbi:ATP-binding protein [Candidatus Omnitrophota bacterium]
MKIIDRELKPKLKAASNFFPVVAIVGPRQSGKTTLAKMAFPNKSYVSLEDLDTREFATSDPRGFLANYPNGAILDEIQRAPHLFSYIQTIVDKQNKPGLFILTGSQHFLMQENISQTLAGRIMILKLLPFSITELTSASVIYDSYEDYLFKGFYPRIYNKNSNSRDWHLSYIQTYVERDLRLIKNIGNLNTFQTFLKMCAARVGQNINLASLANDCGITHNTAKSWLSILELSFIIHLLRPHYKNFNKRLIKMPKLYFYDIGLVSTLLGIENVKQMETHPLKGNLFESFVITELLKKRHNAGLESNLYFWKDKTGHEIDCIIEKSNKLKAVEIKSGKTYSVEYFKNLAYWKTLSKSTTKDLSVIYGGISSQIRSSGNLLSWKDIQKIHI